MIKTITGAITPDEGKVIYEGKEYTELNPILSSQIGIEAIYQEFNLAPELTVQENIYMGTKVNQSIFIDRKELAERTKKILKELNTNIDPNVRIKDLTVAYMQLVEIAKALAKNVKLLIMDEPDVFLDFENIIGLSKLINNYEGTIIAISHNRLLLSQCFNKILHLENKELQEFPGTFSEYNQAMLETKVQMAEQATKDAEWIAVQEKLETQSPTLMRPITLLNYRYNQFAAPGSLLVEVGAAGNSLEEALQAARLFGRGFAETILGQ